MVVYRCCLPTLPTGHFTNSDSNTSEEAKVPLCCQEELYVVSEVVANNFWMHCFPILKPFMQKPKEGTNQRYYMKRALAKEFWKLLSSPSLTENE